MQTLFEVVAAIFTAIGAIFGAYKAFNAYRRSRADARHLDALTAVQDLAEELNTILWNSEAERVMLLKSENGGGVPSPGKARYSTVMMEVHDDKLNGVRSQWQRVLLDQHYNDILLKIYREGGCLISIEDMPKECLLRPMYDASDIQRAYVFLVGVSSKEMFYLVMNQTHLRDMSPETMVTVRQSLGKMIDALDQFEHFVHKPAGFPLAQIT